MRVADYIVSRLADEGIDTIFGITGGGIMHLVDALTLSQDIKFQPVHHEEFAGVCADGYARSGRKFGVAFATTGPGAAHLFTAVAASWQDSVPIILIVGQVKSSDSSRLRGIQVRQNGTFEFDTIGPFSQITKDSVVVKSSQEAVEAFERALVLCQQVRPGPVLIEIPLDVQAMEVSAISLSRNYSNIGGDNAQGKLMQDFSNTLRSELSKASRPLFLFGAGIIRSHSEDLVDELYSILELPYVATQFARAAGNKEHAGFLGSPGVKANRSANIAVSKADLIIAIGTSLHQQVTGWNEEAFTNFQSVKIWTEIDGQTLDSRSHLVDKAFQLESSEAIRTIMQLLRELKLESKKFEVWRDYVTKIRNEYLLHFPLQEREEGRFSIYRAVTILSDRADRFKAVTTDAGIVWYVVPQHFFPSRGSYFISSGSFGAMGMALPLAIGSAAATKQLTLCITGDGSLMTCLQELATLASSGLPILLIVNSNSGYLSIKQTHRKFFEGRLLGTDDSNGVFIPSLEKVAEVFGIKYHKATSEQEFLTLLDSVEIIELDSPILVEVMTLTNQSVEPVIVSRLNEETGKMESGSLINLYPEIIESDL